MAGVNYLGTVSIGACIPIAIAAQAQLSIALGAALPELKAKLAGLLQVSLALTITPPSIELAAKLQAAIKLIGALELSLNLQLPGISLQAGALLQIIAEIELSLGRLNLGLEFAVSLSGLLATAGVCLYAYDGRADQFGPAFTSELSGGMPSGGGPGAQTNAIVLATTSSATWATMKVAFKTE